MGTRKQSVQFPIDVANWLQRFTRGCQVHILLQITDKFSTIYNYLKGQMKKNDSVKHQETKWRNTAKDNDDNYYNDENECNNQTLQRVIMKCQI